LIVSPFYSLCEEISEAKRKEVEERISLINKIIKQKGFSWKAGITSKSYLSLEEMRKYCVEYFNPDELERTSSDYSNYKELREKDVGILKIASIPDWESLMSLIEDQECGNCWAHATTGVVEGLLHYLHGSNIEINLDEMDITNNNTCGSSCSSGVPSCGFSYIQTNKVPSESGSYPNYENAYWDIVSYSTQTPTISTIKSALNNSPVTAVMRVYEDFYNDYEEGIYEYAYGDYVGWHYVVIVGYSDEDSCWTCKNSWGTGWGEDGYFRIAYGECYIDETISSTATVNTSCLAKITPGLISSLNTALGYSFVTNEWAYINTNHSLSENASLPSNKTLLSYGDLTIPSTKKLTINQNCNVKFESGKDLTISAGGEVEVYGGATFTKSSTNWAGIDIQSGSPGGIFDVNGDITIEYAYTGIEVNYNGIDNGSNTITIQNCSNNGIYIGNYSPTINNVLLDNCGSSTTYAAIEINGASANPSIDHVTIESSHRGVNLYGSSDADVDDSDIKSSNDRYSFYLSSYTGLGLDWGYNNICAKYSSDGYIIKQYNATCDYIMARHNYWGVSPPTDALFSHPNNIDYSIHETSSVGGAGIYKMAVDLVASNQFKEARDLEKSKNWAGALDIYKKIIANTDNQQHIRKAIKCILRVNDHSIRDYTALRKIINDNLVRTDSWYRAILDFILCDILVREGNYEEAIVAFSEKADTYKGTSMEVEMLGRIATIYGDCLHDKTKAKEYADKAAAVNPGQYVLRSAYDAADIEYEPFDYIDRFADAVENFDILPEPEEKQSSETDEFVTANPNPFNPITTITYSIKSPSHVSLNVYNITGQKVATLVDNTMSAGVHTVTFDGSNLASGMYFYRFESSDFEKKGKMLLVR